MTNGTKYIILKRCLACWQVNENHLKTCGQCNYLFTSEATEQEKQEANDKMLKLQEKVEEEK